MKKIIALVLVGISLLATAACSTNKSVSSNNLEDYIYEIESKDEMSELVDTHLSPEEQIIIASSESELAWEMLLAHPMLTHEAFMLLTEQQLGYKAIPLLPEAMERVGLTENEQIALIKKSRVYQEALLRAQLFTPESLTVLCEYWDDRSPNQEIQNLFAMAIEINRMTPEQQQRVIDTHNSLLQRELLKQQNLRGETLVYMAQNFSCDIEYVASELIWNSSLTQEQKFEIIRLGEEEFQIAILKRSEVSFEDLYEIAVTTGFRTNPEGKQRYKEAFEKAELSIEQRERIILVASDILA